MVFFVLQLFLGYVYPMYKSMLGFAERLRIYITWRVGFGESKLGHLTFFLHQSFLLMKKYVHFLSD